MYYLLEQDINTGEWETNMTIYGMTPEEVMDKVCPDGMYCEASSPGRMQDYDKDLPPNYDRPCLYGAPCAIMFRIMHPRDSFLDKFVGVIYSIG